MRFFEHSAGAVVYSPGDPIVFLLLRGRFGWDFPHGTVRLEETEEAAALREVKEETGLSVRLIPNFREEIRYVYSRRGRTVYRQIVYFLARSQDRDVKLSKEHEAYMWATKGEAIRMLSRDEARLILLKAWEKIKRVEPAIQ